MAPPIAILGAGPGGLVLARLLHLAKISYTVFERDASSTAITSGGTLDVHADDGQKALKAAGLFDKFKALARYDAQTFKAADKDGNMLWDKNFGEHAERPEIDRKDLRRILLESVPADTIQWGSRVEKVEKEKNGRMAVHLANGTVSRGFKLVVGADGAWSKARELITPAKPIYSGYCYFQTSIQPSDEYYPKACDMIGQGTYTALTGGQALISQRLGTGEYMVYVGTMTAEDQWKKEKERIRSPGFRQHLLDTYYKGWATKPTDLIRHSTGEFHSWPLYHLPYDCLPYKSVPGVTLVGDAAHLAVPNGEGVNCAMYDSYELAEKIKKHGLEDLDEATKEYETEMFPRGLSSIEKGKEMQKTFFAEDSPRGFREWSASVDAMLAAAQATEA
ncbi:FAD/NAD(P)-binding domain-containing protein [Myriangium duriaei CBS 260.36]|uniref:FAD/NAD(P)-binding domain-containing protein n=1 Tax=Myriangium duriaei CBS 260.36 TaxID=1168546 RepID=A0A9P4MMM7_9PEZI|nr:FAD/NAD(P)-binding domain-containing protein [Myriangium duriaei CBS 260.36]